MLGDGREISAPLAWYPRLRDGTPAQRRHWRFIGRGEGIHWPDLDDPDHAQAWAALLDWMRDVLVARHPAAARVLRPCWWQHADAVDAITAAWLTWQAAYRNPSAEPRDLATWQGTWRPQMIEQIKAALGSCSGGHCEPATPPDVVGGYSTGASTRA